MEGRSDAGGRRDRRGAGRQAHRHHRLDRASSAPRWSSACCARCPAASWCCWSGPAAARRPTSGCSGRSCATTPSTACAAELGAAGFDEMTARRVRTITGDVGTDGLGLDEDDRATLATLRHRHPLGGHGRLRLAARQRRRDQPARPDPHRARCSTSWASPPTSSPCRPATWPATAGAGRPRSWWPRGRSTSASTGRPRWPRPAGCAPTPRPRAARPSMLAALPRRRPATSSAPPARPRWRPRPSSAASGGWPTAWSRPGGPGPPASAGPTPTPTRRRSASRP